MLAGDPPEGRLVGVAGTMAVVVASVSAVGSLWGQRLIADERALAFRDVMLGDSSC